MHRSTSSRYWKIWCSVAAAVTVDVPGVWELVAPLRGASELGIFRTSHFWSENFVEGLK
jgi:hypothetical protein